MGVANRASKGHLARQGGEPVTARDAPEKRARLCNWKFVAAIITALAAALAVYILAEAGAGGAIVAGRLAKSTAGEKR